MSSFTDPDSPEFLAKIRGLSSGIADMSEVARLVDSGDFDSAVEMAEKVFEGQSRDFHPIEEFEECLTVLVEKSPEAVERLEAVLNGLYVQLRKASQSRSLAEKVIFLSRYLNQGERFVALFEELNQGDDEPFEFNSVALGNGIDLFLASGRADIIRGQFPRTIHRFFITLSTLEPELIFIRRKNEYEEWDNHSALFEEAAISIQAPQAVTEAKLCFRLALEYGADDIAEYIGRRVCSVLQDDQFRADLAVIARTYGRDALAETLEKQ
ncbi:MAG: hypothetical protein KC652_14140 [Cyanobacteria bacterium HKST-UBA01]|nr:hypothetical protein [Cyanobacteria bacterium HKST-UBA01]